MRWEEQIGVVVVQTTAPTCKPTWAIGAPIGLSVASVGMLQIRSPVTGLRYPSQPELL